MRIWKVGICNRDAAFVTNLMEYVNRTSELPIRAIAFTKMQAVVAYIQDGSETLDLIITDNMTLCIEDGEGYMCESIRCKAWSDYPVEGSDKAIFKYQRADRLWLEVLCSLKSDRILISEESIWAVFSPLGRCGKTTLAKGLAYAKRKGGGLYISMDAYSRDELNTDSELLFHVKTKNTELAETLHGLCTQENNMSSLIMAKDYRDLWEVQKEDIEFLNAMLLQSGFFHTLVYDLGSAILRDFSILEIPELIFVPTVSNAYARNKLDRFYDMLKETEYSYLLRKMKEVEVPVGNYDEKVVQSWVGELWKI